MTSESPHQLLDLQRACEVADAKLAVAEDFAWPVAGFAGMLAHLLVSFWPVTIAAALAGYVVSVYGFRSAAAKAEDRYFQAARLGKYSKAGGQAEP